MEEVIAKQGTVPGALVLKERQKGSQVVAARGGVDAVRLPDLTVDVHQQLLGSWQAVLRPSSPTQPVSKVCETRSAGHLEQLTGWWVDSGGRVATSVRLR